jgi:hypothetical protein
MNYSTFRFESYLETNVLHLSLTLDKFSVTTNQCGLNQTGSFFVLSIFDKLLGVAETSVKFVVVPQALEYLTH